MKYVAMRNIKDNNFETIVLNNNNLNSIEINQFYESLIELSNTFPASYGLFSIFLAIP